MPVYEYTCKCGRREDVVCGCNERPNVKCECGHTMQRIFSVPSIVTNDTFMAGRSYDYLDNDPIAAARAMKKAKEQGVSTSTGNHYSQQLGMWISSKDDVQSACERRGWGCEGMVNVKKAETEPSDEPYRPADDLIDRHAEMVINQKHGGSVSKKERKRIKEELSVSLAGNPD